MPRPLQGREDDEGEEEEELWSAAVEDEDDRTEAQQDSSCEFEEQLAALSVLTSTMLPLRSKALADAVGVL